MTKKERKKKKPKRYRVMPAKSREGMKSSETEINPCLCIQVI